MEKRNEKKYPEAGTFFYSPAAPPREHKPSRILRIIAIISGLIYAITGVWVIVIAIALISSANGCAGPVLFFLFLPGGAVGAFLLACAYFLFKGTLPEKLLNECSCDIDSRSPNLDRFIRAFIGVGCFLVLMLFFGAGYGQFIYNSFYDPYYTEYKRHLIDSTLFRFVFVIGLGMFYSTMAALFGYSVARKIWRLVILTIPLIFGGLFLEGILILWYFE